MIQCSINGILVGINKMKIWNHILTINKYFQTISSPVCIQKKSRKMLKVPSHISTFLQRLQFLIVFNLKLLLLLIYLLTRSLFCLPITFSFQLVRKLFLNVATTKVSSKRATLFGVCLAFNVALKAVNGYFMFLA